MKLFYDIKNKVHDSSGIDKPQNYYWESNSNNNVYYPKREIQEDEIHEEIRKFLSENDLPQISLDEISLSDFTIEQKDKRDFFLSMF